MRMYGHLNVILGNHKWLNYNERIELFVVRNGHLMVRGNILLRFNDHFSV